MAAACRLPPQFRVEEVYRLAFDDFGDLGVEGEVVGVDGVERLAGSADEFHCRRVAGLGPRIDLQTVLEVLGRRIRFTVDQQATEDEHVHRTRGPADEVAVRYLAVVVGRHDQVLPALPAVGSGGAHVDDEPEVGVVDRAGPAPRWHLYDGGTVGGQVEQGEGVNGVGVPGEEQRVGIHQLVEDHHLVGRCYPESGQAPADALQ